MQLQVSADVWRASEVLTDLALAAADLNPFWVEVTHLLQDAARDRFVTDGQGDWPPLDRDTILRRLGRGIASTAVLEASGRLRDSLTQTHHPDAVRRIEGDRMVFGTRVLYAEHVAQRRDPLPEVDGRLAGAIGDTLIAHLMGDL